MSNTGGASSGTVLLARWVGRAIGSLVVAFWLFIIVVSAVTDDGEPWTWESTGVVVLSVASAISVFVAWRREGTGATLVLICGLAYSLFAYISAGHNKGMAVLIAGGPLIVSGILLLASWRGSKREKDTS